MFKRTRNIASRTSPPPLPRNFALAHSRDCNELNFAFSNSVLYTVPVSSKVRARVLSPLSLWFVHRSGALQFQTFRECGPDYRMREEESDESRARYGRDTCVSRARTCAYGGGRGFMMCEGWGINCRWLEESCARWSASLHRRRGVGDRGLYAHWGLGLAD